MTSTWQMAISSLGLGALMVLGGCAAELMSADESNGAVPTIDDNDYDRADAGTSYPDVPGEVDFESFLLSRPVASRSFVFIANRTRGTLAKVAVEGTAIQIATVRVGSDPTEIRTLPDADIAVVLNEGSDTIAVVEAAPFGVDDTVHIVDILDGCNQLSLAPSGNVAFAYYNNAYAEAGDETGAFSEVSVVRLDGDVPEVYQMTVGINVRGIQYDDSGEFAYVITDDGVGILEVEAIEEDGYVVPVPLDAPGEAPPVGSTREVFISGDGAYAILSDGYSEALRVVELATGDLADVVLPGSPADLDLIPASGQAIVTLRDSDTVALVDLEQVIVAADPEVETDDDGLLWFTMGQTVRYTVVDGAGERAVVVGWNEADPFGETEIMVFDIEDRTVAPVSLLKGVQGVVISPSGRHAIVFHNKAPGIPVAGAPADEITAKSFAVSVVNLVSGDTKLVRLDAWPTEVAFTETGSVAFVLAVSEETGIHDMHRIDLASLRTDRYSFDRLPEHVGVIDSANMAYVSQAHDLGRIAFIDVETGEQREITGFELNGLIE